MDRRGDPLLRSGFPGRPDRLGSDEARVLLAAPPEPGLDRPARLHQVVAVEVEADLQAQRVARPEPGRLRATLSHRVPPPYRVLAAKDQLDALLSGVAGAADQDVRGAGHGHHRG